MKSMDSAEKSSVRHRASAGLPGKRGEGEYGVESSRRGADMTHGRRPPPLSPLLGGSVWLFVFTFYAVLMLYIHHKSTVSILPVSISSSTHDQFVEERARKHLDDLTAFGSRPVGSRANEVLAVDYLLGEIETIRRSMDTSLYQMDVDVQLVSGTFSLDFLGQFTSYYHNVKNIVVQFGPKESSGHSLLINCHYDSALNTTGASDDTVSCCVMLEVLRVMSQSKNHYLHNIIFLFNGAEENILQASHGFITQHPWAKEVRAFVNLEACGAGGKQLLFQSGPEHPWLVSMYAKYAPHPFASIVGQEIFQSGLIPSDTDYRIFRDYGNLPGLDIAYIHNGYIYHTVFDRPEMIPAGAIQQAGDNLLAVVTAIVKSPLLADPGEYKHGHLVFFDFLGHFMIVYSLRVGTIINVMAVIAVMIWIGRKMLNRSSHGFSGFAYVKQLLKALSVVAVSLVCAVLCALSVAYLLDFFGYAMTWYSNTMLIVGLFMAPAASAMLLTACAAKRLFYKDATVNVWNIEAVYFDVTLIIFTSLLSVMTYYELCSAIMVLIPVVSSTVIRLGAVCLFRLSPTEHQRTFLTVHFIGQLVPNLLLLWFMYGALVMFIPIMGRAGNRDIPDIAIAALACFLLTVLMWQIGLVFATRSMRWVNGSLLAVFAASLILAVFTPVGFPYHANPESPTRQRHIIHHLERTFHDINGHVTFSDSGILHLPFDRNAHRHLNSVSMLKEAKSTDCVDMPYCGWPYYFPMIRVIDERRMKYIPGPRLEGLTKPRLSVISYNRTKPDLVQVTLSVEGPNHINIYISPKPHVELVRWSLGDGHPKPTYMPDYVNRSNYFVFYSYGSKPDQPLEFTVDLAIADGQTADGGLIDIALGGHYVTAGDVQYTSEVLERYVHSLPDWTTSIPWPATYDAWII